MLFVSHLSTPEGHLTRKAGGPPLQGITRHRLLERDQQAEDEEDRSTTTYRMLKDRYTGRSTGETYSISYDQKTGHLVEADDELEMLSDETEAPF